MRHTCHSTGPLPVSEQLQISPIVSLSLSSQMGYVGRYLSVIYVFVLGNFINISYAWNITNHFGTDIAQVVPYIVAILPFLVAVPVVLFIRRGKALPIQMFYFNQVIIAISAVFLSICLPMIMTPFPIRSLTTVSGDYIYS